MIYTFSRKHWQFVSGALRFFRLRRLISSPQIVLGPLNQKITSIASEKNSQYLQPVIHLKALRMQTTLSEYVSGPNKKFSKHTEFPEKF